MFLHHTQGQSAVRSRHSGHPTDHGDRQRGDGIPHRHETAGRASQQQQRRLQGFRRRRWSCQRHQGKTCSSYFQNINHSLVTKRPHELMCKMGIWENLLRPVCFSPNLTKHSKVQTNIKMSACYHKFWCICRMWFCTRVIRSTGHHSSRHWPLWVERGL